MADRRETKWREGGENYIMRSQVKEDEMGGACSTSEGEEECI
jgi:hypothetical protein